MNINALLSFWISFIVVTGVIFLLARTGMLNDTSTQGRKPYSLARALLTWWTGIILVSFLSTFLSSGCIPTLRDSTLTILGIAAATAAAARVIDLSDRSHTVARSQDNSPGRGFFQDILSDENGVSVHRFQIFAFNLSIGVWFLAKVYQNLDQASCDYVMPEITSNNLVLLGLSSSIYAGLKITENQGSPRQPGVSDL